MARKLIYKIEDDIVRCSPEGPVSADSLADLVSDVVHTRDKSKGVVKVLLDARRATFEGRPDDLKNITRKFQEYYKKFEQIKVAAILQNPYETAVFIVLKEKLKSIPNLVFGMFSTESAALKWLK